MTHVKESRDNLRVHPKPVAHVTCVRRVALFRGLSRAQQDQAGALARPVELEKGEYLGVGGPSDSAPAGSGEAVPGDGARAGARLAVLHTGRVALVRPLPVGGERVVRLAEAGDFIGEAAFLTGRDPGTVVRAIEPTRLCTFAHDDLAPLLAAHPPIAAAMLRSLAGRLADAERRLSLASETGPVRVAAYLLDLPGARLPDGTARVSWPLRKKDAASLLGMTPESLSRALASLRSRGLIAASATASSHGSEDEGGAGARAGVLLLDLDGLKRLAEA